MKNLDHSEALHVLALEYNKLLVTLNQIREICSREGEDDVSSLLCDIDGLLNKNDQCHLIKNLVAVSEDEDVEDIGGINFEVAIRSLNDLRDEQPNKAWHLMAEIEA